MRVFVAILFGITWTCVIMGVFCALAVWWWPMIFTFPLFLKVWAMDFQRFTSWGRRRA
jgi:hypothetical protein